MPLKVNGPQAIQTIAVLAGSKSSGLSYESSQVRNIYVEASSKDHSSHEDTPSCYVLSNGNTLVQVSEFATADLTTIPQIFKTQDFNNIG